MVKKCVASFQLIHFSLLAHPGKYPSDFNFFLQVNFLTEKKIFLTTEMTIPVWREITNYTLSQSNAFLFVRYDFVIENHQPRSSTAPGGI